MGIQPAKPFNMWKFLIPPAIMTAALIVVYMNGPKPVESKTEAKKATRNYPIMGTMASVTLYGPYELTEKAADTVYDVFKEVETTCNIFNPQSELARLNKEAFEHPFKCSPLLWDALQGGRKAWKMSNGAFDITARPLMVLWGFYRKQKKLPSAEEINKALSVVGLDKVEFNDKNRTVKFKVKGMSFDLGGIAKGFAVDRAVNAVKKLGVKRGIINLAGNMYCFPEPPPGRDFYLIGIRNPVCKAEECGIIEIKDISIATSGNYERYVVIDGKRYTHIMNVKTGQPVTGMLSVSVVTPLAETADALSTSIFINGEEFARKICSELPRTSALIIRESNQPGKKFDIIKIGEIWEEINLD